MATGHSSGKAGRHLTVGLVLIGCMLFGLERLVGEPVSEAPTLDPEASAQDGEYLARAANCQACHTHEGGAPYAGGVPFNTPFGTLYSTNITPDTATGIGHWQFADFYAAMKTGVAPGGRHLYPAFPYTDYALLTDRDIASLFLFLQTLAPVDAPSRPNKLDFPFDQRALLVPWKALFHRAETYVPDPARSARWNRGAYLIEGAGHCGACHSPRNIFGAEQAALAMTGGVHEGPVKLGFSRSWSAVNLTSADIGLASWSEEDIVNYLKTGQSKQAIVHGPMRDVVMHSTRFLRDEDLQAMAVYLKSLPPRVQDSGPAADDVQLATGEQVYTVHCGSCHLPTGLGSEGLGVSLSRNPIVQAPDPASLINVILYGPHLPGPPFAVDRSPMKMFGKRLSDSDIAALASYLRSSFGNRAGAVTPAQVKVQR